jgi:hypothetical protein
MSGFDQKGLGADAPHGIGLMQSEKASRTGSTARSDRVFASRGFDSARPCDKLQSNLPRPRSRAVQMEISDYGIAMKYSTAFRVGFLLLLFACGCPVAAEQVDDLEDVQTPTDFGELVPEGVFEKTNIDFYLQRKDQSGGDEGCLHWTAKPVDDTIVVTQRQASKGFGVWSTLQVVYHREHGLVSFRSKQVFTEKMQWVLEGKVVGDELVVTKIRTNKDSMETSRIPMKDLVGKLHSACEPLVFAYHVRKESLDFTANVTDFDQYKKSKSFENLGTEEIKFGNEKVKTHVFRWTINKTPLPKELQGGPNPPMREKIYHVNDAGEILKIQVKYWEPDGQFVTTSERLSKEEGENRFAEYEKTKKKVDDDPAKKGKN